MFLILFEINLLKELRMEIWVNNSIDFYQLVLDCEFSGMATGNNRSCCGGFVFFRLAGCIGVCDIVTSIISVDYTETDLKTVQFRFRWEGARIRK